MTDHIVSDEAGTMAGPPALAWPSTLDERDVFVETSVGIVHARRQGQGPTLLLLHSNGHSWREFARMIDPLAERFDVIAWDMPGQGDSDTAHPRMSIDAYADIAIELLDALDVRDAIVCGTSVGAFIAASLATRHPERVRAVALVEFQFTGPEFWQEIWPFAERLFSAPTHTRDDVAAQLETEFDDALLERWNVDRYKSGTRARLGVAWAVRNYQIDAAVRALAQPTVVVFGAAGPALHGKEAVEAALPAGARVVVVDGAGHFLAIDQPERFVSELTCLADGVDGDATSAS